jgi:hypothetical protein
MNRVAANLPARHSSSSEEKPASAGGHATIARAPRDVASRREADAPVSDRLSAFAPAK